MKTNINRLLEDNLVENRRKTALICADIEYSYEDINNWKKKIEQYITKMNCFKGDRVLIISDNTAEVIPTIFALANLEISFSIISKDINPNQIIKNFNPKIILVNNENYDYEVLEYRKLEVMIGRMEVFSSLESNGKYFSSWNCVCVIYTSGSTGEPKGVAISNDNILFTTKQINEYIQNGKDDIILSYLPLTFDYGLYQIFLSFFAHATLVIDNYPSFPGEVFSTIRKYKVTGFPGIRGILDVFRLHINYEDIKSLKYISNTGDYFNLEIINKLKKIKSNINFFLMYGLTECKRVSILNLNMYPNKMESVGLPLRDIEVSVQKNNEECSPFEIGTLHVKGRNVCLGYFNNPEETAKYFSRYSLETKDLFYKDEDGFLYFFGRKDSNFKSKGHLISAEYLELKINKMLEFNNSFVVYLEDTKNFYIVSYIVEIDNFYEEQFIKKYKDLFYSWEIPKDFIFYYEYYPINKNGKVDRKIIEGELRAHEKI